MNERGRRIISYALERREAYIIVIVVFAAVMAAILGHWDGWVIGVSVLGGALLLGLLVLDSLSDPQAESDAALIDIDTSRLHDRALRSTVEKGIDYVRAVRKIVRGDHGGLLSSAGDELPQMEEAVRAIYKMSLRVEHFRQDALIRRDLAELRSARGGLSESRKEQLQTLEELDRLVESATAELDRAVAELGRSYAEIQSIRLTPELRGTSAAALDDLNKSTRRLSDMADGYDKVFGRSSETGTRG